MALSPADAAKKMRQTADALREAKRDAVKAAALSATTIIRAEIKQAAPSGRLTPRQVRVGAGYQVYGTDAAPYAEIRPRGPIGLIEGDIKAHDIRPRSRRKPKAGSKRTALAIGGNFRAVVRHPGTKGKHPWEKGVGRALKVSGVQMSEVASRRMLKVWT
jgi:hypothetical protein